MKIIYLIARFHPYSGGAEQNCLELATRAAQQKHEVTVLTTDASPDGKPLAAVEIYRGLTIRRLHRWNQELNLGFYPRLLPALLFTPADVIHVCNGPGFMWHEFCLIAVRLFRRRVRVITTPHGPFLATPETHSFGRRALAQFGKLLLFPYFRFVWPRLFDAVIAVTTKQTSWLTRSYGVPATKIHVIPNGISRSLIPHRIPAKATTPVQITFLGRMARYKGVDQVLQALHKIKPELEEDWYFTVMGRPGSAQQEWPALASRLNLGNNVAFIINPTDSERDALLDNSHIHILPSQWEATGIGLIEAMAKGNALITTHQNEGADRIITHGANGYIYHYGDINTLAEILQTLIRNDDLRGRMIKLNWERAAQFTWEAIFPDYANLLARITAT